MSIPAVNSTTPGASQSSQAATSLALTSDNFLKLLTVQLKNQDPTSPLDTNAITQQIASLSQVEQQIATNKNLESLLAAFTATQYNNAVNYIGKMIEAPGDAGALKNGQGLFTYYLGDKADHASITIKDQAGNVVFEGSATTDLGRNEYVWDGKSSSGQTMANGNYTFEITAEDASNGAVPSQTYTSGVVTSVDSINGIVYLSIDNLSVDISKVLSIKAASQISQI
jgi:flagellar basal-body rod modification protein FlgD